MAEVRQKGETNENKGSDEYLTHVLVGNRNFLDNPRRVRHFFKNIFEKNRRNV